MDIAQKLDRALELLEIMEKNNQARIAQCLIDGAMTVISPLQLILNNEVVDGADTISISKLNEFIESMTAGIKKLQDKENT